MKVLLHKNVSKLGHIGDVVDVKPGYARNYLIARGLAVQPTQANIRAVEQAKQEYLQELAKIRTELEAKAKVVDGREIIIPARANEEGHLYGSIGPAQIAAALVEQDIFVEVQHIALDEPIRQIGTYETPLHFGQDITAAISISVVAIDPDASDSQAAQGPGNAGDDDPDEDD